MYKKLSQLRQNVKCGLPSGNLPYHMYIYRYRGQMFIILRSSHADNKAGLSHTQLWPRGLLCPLSYGRAAQARSFRLCVSWPLAFCFQLTLVNNLFCSGWGNPSSLRRVSGELSTCPQTSPACITGLMSPWPLLRPLPWPGFEWVGNKGRFLELRAHSRLKSPLPPTPAVSWNPLP